jgi:hypothetical protein
MGNPKELWSKQQFASLTWRVLQSKAGIENREYKAQRSILAEVDAGRLSKEELFARGEHLLRERVQEASPARLTEQTRRLSVASSQTEIQCS